MDKEQTSLPAQQPGKISGWLQAARVVMWIEGLGLIILGIPAIFLLGFGIVLIVLGAFIIKYADRIPKREKRTYKFAFTIEVIAVLIAFGGLVVDAISRHFGIMDVIWVIVPAFPLFIFYKYRGEFTAETEITSNANLASSGASASAPASLKNSFIPTKLKILLSAIFAFLAIFFATGTLIVAADSYSQGLLTFAFVVYPPGLLAFWAPTASLGSVLWVVGYILEFFYAYLWVAILILLSREFRQHKRVGYSVLAALLVGIIGFGIYEYHQPVQCGYSEQALTPPPVLVGATFTLTSGEFVAAGPAADHDYGCVPSLSTIPNEITTHEAIDNPTVGASYYTSHGLTVNPLAQGTTFTMVKLIQVSDISGYNSPLDFIILKSSDGTLYYDVDDDFGYDASSSVMSFTGADGQTGFLSYQFFENYPNQQITTTATEPASLTPENPTTTNAMGTSQNRIVTLNRPSGNSITIQRGATLTVQWQTSGGVSTDYVNFDIAPASSSVPHTENPDVRDEGTYADEYGISFPVTVPPGRYILSASLSDNCDAAENCDQTPLNPPITLIVTGTAQALSVGSSSVSVLDTGIFTADNSCAPRALVVANDEFGFHMEGLGATLKSSRTADSIIAENSTTDLDGNAVFDITSSQPGTSTLTAWVNGTEIGTTMINFVSPANQSCTIYQEG